VDAGHSVVLRLHIAALAHATVELEAVVDVLLQQHVKIHTLSRYFLAPPTHVGLVLREALQA
jgi:hypothetical protein